MKSPGFKQLKVYQMAYRCAMEIFVISTSFPKEEKYSLTDQIRRSSRNVCANISEAYRKRKYPRHFSLKLTDADGECSETMVWLDFAFDCAYIDRETYDRLTTACTEVGKMLGGMAEHPERFLPKHGDLHNEPV